MISLSLGAVFKLFSLRGARKSCKSRGFFGVFCGEYLFGDYNGNFRKWLEDFVVYLIPDLVLNVVKLFKKDRNIYVFFFRYYLSYLYFYN